MLNETAQLQFTEFLGRQNLRLTPQRVAILEAALSPADPFTAEELLIKARERDASASRATVYRTITLLVEGALLREIDIGKDHKYYTPQAPSKNFQAQIICADCDKICEIDAPFMDWYSKSVAGKLDMEPLSARLQVVAKCTKGCSITP